MKKIKSAAELAMEKTQQLKNEPLDTTSDIEKYIKAARKLAQNVAYGKTEVQKIKESLERYPSKSLPEVISVMLHEFSNMINLDNTPRLLQSISLLKNDETTEQSLKEVNRLYQKYHTLREQKVKEVEEASQKHHLKRLNDQGISGTAIYKIILQEDLKTQSIKEEIDQEYRRDLSGFLSYLTKE